MQNSIDELYTFFKFLRIKPLNDWNNFKETIADPVKAGRTARAMKRLHVGFMFILPTIEADHCSIARLRCDHAETHEDYHSQRQADRRAA